MSIEENQDNNSEIILKPELAFDWIKYKKTTSPPTANHFTNIDSPLPSEIESFEKSSELVKNEGLTRQSFKDDSVLERLYLWYEALFKNLEMTLEEFSKVIEVADQTETEEFLFRHAPLKYGYLWRGKTLKFSEDTIKKLEEELNK